METIRKKGVSFVLAIFFILSKTIIFAPVVLAADVTLSINSSAGLQQAIDDAETTPTVIYITEDLALGGTVMRIPATADITIKSNGNPAFTLFQNSYDVVSRRHFYVAGKLTLENIVLDGGIGTLNSANCGGGIRVDSTGTLILNSGAIIQNCLVGNNLDDYVYSTSAVGGGVYLVPGGGSMEMNEGAIIKGNKADGDGRGGGVYVGHESQMIMTGGKITNNEAAGSETYGGGVIVYQGFFEMSGNASIVGNKAYVGGGVFVGETAYDDIVGGGSFKMNGGTISGNSAVAGGGIFARGSAVEFIINGGEISKNTTTLNHGAGVYVYFSTLTSDSSVISGNESAAQGGGIFVYTGKLVISDSQIASNKAAAQGGGIYAYSSEVSVNGGVIGGLETEDANVATAGGGIYMQAAPLTITDGSIIGNRATSGNGGGICVNSSSSGGAVTVLGKSTIAGNSAASGAGIYSGSSNGTVTISDTTTIDKNRASGDGGGIYLVANNTLTIDGSCSIINNSALGNGGGIYTEDTTYQNLATDYANLTVAAATAFFGNTAAAAYAPPENAASLYPNIGFVDASTSSHPINNYDINYISDAPITCKLTYDANGGAGGCATSDTEPGSSATVLSANDAGISNGDYRFAGWNTKADGTGTSYLPGSEIMIWNNVTLYAQWAAAEPENPSSQENPSTGDNNNMPLLIGMLLFSLLLGMSIVLGYGKKHIRRYSI